MITNEDYFSHPDFNYEDIKDKLESVIDEGIEKYGEACIHLDSEYEAGQVVVYKELDWCEGGNIGHAVISLRYLRELLHRVSEAGLKYKVLGSSERYCTPTRVIIFVSAE